MGSLKLSRTPALMMRRDKTLNKGLRETVNALRGLA